MNHECKQQQQQEEKEQKQLTEGRTTHKRGYFLLVSLLPSVHAEGDKGKRMHGSFPFPTPLLLLERGREREKEEPMLHTIRTKNIYNLLWCTPHVYTTQGERFTHTHKTHREKGRRGIASPSDVQKDAPTDGCWLLNKETGAQQAHPYTHKTYRHTNRYIGNMP